MSEPEERRLIAGKEALPPQIPLLTSADNKNYKRFRRLLAGKDRRQGDLIPLEGLRLCETALAAGCRPRLCLFSEDQITRAVHDRATALIRRCGGAAGCQLWKLSPRLFSSLAQTDHPQGILILAELPAAPPWTARPGQLKRGLLLACGVQDPGNLGTLIRTADAFALDGLVADSRSASFSNPKVVRSTMGSLFQLPLLRRDDLVPYVRQLQAAGALVIAAVLPGEPLPDVVAELSAGRAAERAAGGGEASPSPSAPRILLVGNEGAGLPEELVALADYKAYIPQRAGTESLNVAVAAGILCYALFEL